MEYNRGINDFVIRPAGQEDAGLLLEFIRGLADYEKLSHEVVATPELLRKNLFEKKCGEAVIGFYRNEPVSFALFFTSFSTFLGKPGLYLEDLFVKPEFRGKGFGKAMLIYLAKLAVERDYGRFEWSVLDWNTPAIDFYKSLGAVPMDEWTTFRLTGDALKGLAGEESGFHNQSE